MRRINIRTEWVIEGLCIAVITMWLANWDPTKAIVGALAITTITTVGGAIDTCRRLEQDRAERGWHHQGGRR